MSLQLQPTPARPRLSADERERLRQVAAAVGSAAGCLCAQGPTAMARSDLEALGMFAVWSKLPSFDPTRASFERWAFFQALAPMIDANRGQRRETSFQAALRDGVRRYVAQDHRSAESDFHHDTPASDRARVRQRTLRLGASALLQATIERVEGGGEIEQPIAAAEAVLIVREEVARLSDEQRTYLHLRFWDDQEVRDVAQRMGISERTLQRRWVETRDLLAARLRARGIIGIPEGFGEAADAVAAATADQDGRGP